MNNNTSSTKIANDKQSKTELSVVIPIYNESENVVELHKNIRYVLEKFIGTDYEIIFVDDGSDDGSFELLHELHKEDNKVKVIRFRRNFGQTAALAAGFDYAKSDVIITMDGDLQNDPSDIPLLIRKIQEGYDIVSGWRRHRKDKLITRKIPSRIANFLISKLTGVRLHDYGCTLKAYRREVVKNINLYGEMHRFIPAIASWMGATVIETQVIHHPRKHGKAKYGLSRTLRVLLDLITVKFFLSYFTRPIQIFGVLGILSMLLGFASGIAVTLMKLLAGVDMTGNPLLLLTVFLFIVGFLFIVLGLLGEITIRTYFESQNKSIYVIKDVLQ